MQDNGLDTLTNVFGYLPEIYGQQNQQTLLNQNGDQSITSLSSLAVGAGNTAMYVDGSKQGMPSGVGGMWLGNTSMPSAPFSVDMDGNLRATSATISGAITGGTIDIGAGFHVDANGNMWLGSGTFAAALFSVTLGGVLKATSGTLSGLTISTSTGGNRIVFNPSSDEIDFYVANVLKGYLRATTSHSGGIQVGVGDLDIINNQSVLFNETSGTAFARIGVNGANQLIITLPSTNQFFMTDSSGTPTNLFTVSSTNGGFLDKQGFIMGNGTNDNTKPRVIKTGESVGSVSSNSFLDIGPISFGYTFGSIPFVVATCDQAPNGPHEWNIGVDNETVNDCHFKCREVAFTNITGTIKVNWIAIGTTT